MNDGLDRAAGTPPAALLDEARAILPDIVAARRRLHRVPEVGLHLPLTQAIVIEELERLGLEARRGDAVSSVVAVIEGSRPGPTVLLRADMDGLPVGEDTGLPFASEHAGVMHACGHDTHVAMLLGGVRLLLARRDELAGRVLLVFQPGEEGWHGARFMLDEGLLDSAGTPGPTRSFALHISTRYPTGTVNLRSGAMLAASDTLAIEVRGRGGHASTPHLAVDPVAVAAEILLALQVMVTRQVHAFEPAVITVTRMDAGTATNIIPELASLHGTIRTTSETTRSVVLERIHQVADGIAAAHGATAETRIEPGYPITLNAPASTAIVRALAVGLLGPDAVHDMEYPVMGAEDFSYVLQRVPGCFAFLGARPLHEDPATAPQNHSNRVVFDEAALAVGAALHAEVARDVLAQA